LKVFGITGWKNSGKTHLMERLVAEFKNRNLSVSTIKNAHHGFDVDQPGKDSFRHRQAGAQEVLVASEKRWVLMHENNADLKPSLTDLIKKLSKVDLVLIEGFKQDKHPKIEVVRQIPDHNLIAENDLTILAVATDVELTIDKARLDLNDTKSIANFIGNYLEL
jgi:molybdopterin-guanine dinucleotide biosynthesis protein MobB